MRTFLDNIYFTQGLITLVTIGVITRVMTWMSYRRLLQDSSEMEGKKKRWMGVLRKRFENYYQLEAKVHNVTCIVDRELLKHRICGLPARFMERGTRLCAVGCFFLGALGALIKYNSGEMLDFLIPGILTFMVAGIFLLGLNELISVKEKQGFIRANMLYFLENVLPNRLEKEDRKKEKEKVQKAKEEEKEKEIIKEQKREVKEIKHHWEEVAATKEFALTPEEMQMMREFLHEI